MSELSNIDRNKILNVVGTQRLKKVRLNDAVASQRFFRSFRVTEKSLLPIFYRKVHTEICFRRDKRKRMRGEEKW
jgi:hypothetical protein